ncbi:5568_t:CDS:2 [Ambispora leptoticha]|uniref:5568_t:CDS:1 n=1 Tax=Ambispora leptoticha TaxID=144679 RepID=A0A9N8Z5Y1_9GLOM|nr:5568_t:CDS:2 [Ambispora leptoticha]
MSFEDNVWEFDETPQHPALLLPSPLVKQITECLDSQVDRLNLCLVHRAWSPTAIEVLWSEPVFKSPDSFLLFIRTVQQSKQCALRVHILNMCAPEEQEKHAFVPVLQSQREEHLVMQPMLMSKPNIIMNIIRLCENLESLKIYGWNLDDKHIYLLPQYCRRIKNIRIIGNAQITQQALYSLTNSLAKKLEVLDLDAEFNLSDNFADTLAIKCPNLKTLKFSTKTMSSRGFDMLAAKLYNLRKLVLQDCPNLTDDNLSHFIESNPDLTEIAVHGDLLTIKSFKTILCSLQNLRRLDLRCSPQSLIISHDTSWFMPISRGLLVLLLDCLPVDDELIHAVSNACKQLEKFGLSRCPYVTNASVKYVAENAKNLRFVNFLKCPKISEICLKDLGCSANNTLRELIVDSCGEFSREAIHWFAGTSPRLEKMEIHGLQSIIDSDLYKFSKEYNSNSQDSINLLRCTFEGENIKKLADYDISIPMEILNNTQHAHKDKLLNLLTPEHTKSSDSILINESIINDLACELGLNVDTLNNALKKVLAKSKFNSLLHPAAATAASATTVSHAPSRSHREKETENQVSISNKASKSNADNLEAKIKSGHTEKKLIDDKKPSFIEAQQKERTPPIKSPTSPKRKEWSNVLQKTKNGWSTIYVKLPGMYRSSPKEAQAPEASSPIVHEAIAANTEEHASPSSTSSEKNELFIKLNDIKKNEPVISSNVTSNVEDVLKISSDGTVKIPELETTYDVHHETVTGTAANSNTQSEKVEVTQSRLSTKPQTQSISDQLQNTPGRLENFEVKPSSSPAWNIQNDYEKDLGRWHVQNDYGEDLGGWHVQNDYGEDLGGWEEMGSTSMFDMNKAARNNTFDNMELDYSDENSLNQDSIVFNQSQQRETDIDEKKWPSLADASQIKDKDTKKGNDDLDAWGSSINFTSAWGTPKKWKSETEEVKVTTAPPAWNANDVYKLKSTPLPEPKYFKPKKVKSTNYDLDDREGWGPIPENCIPWTDQARQGYNHELIQEQNETIYHSKIEHKWINCTNKYNNSKENPEEDTRDPEDLDDTLKKGKRTRGDGNTWETIRDNTRAFESLEDNARKELEPIKAFSSIMQNLKADNYNKPNYERLGNPQWKTEEEWRKFVKHNKQASSNNNNLDIDPDNNNEIPILSENDDKEYDESDLEDTNRIKDTYEASLNESKEAKQEESLSPNIDSGHGSEEEALNDKTKMVPCRLEEDKDQIQRKDDKDLIDTSVVTTDESAISTINEKDDNKNSNHVVSEKSYKQEGITSNEQDSSKRSTSEKNAIDIPIEITIEVLGGGKQSLVVRKSDNLEQIVDEFCQKWQMKEYETSLQEAVKKKLKSKSKAKRSGSKTSLPCSNMTAIDSVMPIG